MSRHEKEEEQEDAYTKTLITPSLHLCFSLKLPVHIYNVLINFVLKLHPSIAHKQRCRDGVINVLV